MKRIQWNAVRRAALVLVAVSGGMLGVASNAWAQASDRHHFDIPAGDLGKALTLLAQQAEREVVFPADIARGKRSVAVKGDLTAKEALDLVLAHTGLSYRLSATGPVVVEVPADPLGGSGPSAAELAGAAPGRGASASVQLEEVVVTAQKRKERLLDVPIAITVLGGEQLDRSTDRGVADALNQVPGVVSSFNTGTSRLGASSGGVVIVRGIAPQSGASTTGYYLDSMPFGFVGDLLGGNFSPDPSVYDLERVEVLRGPQGTLYGVNALNGVVRVLTKDPDLDKFEFKGRLTTASTAHGSETYRGDAAVNIPLIEGKLAARAVVGYADWGGWIDKPNKKDANETKISNYRLKIAAQPTDRLSAELTGWKTNSDMGAPPNGADGLSSIFMENEPSRSEFDGYGFNVSYQLPSFTVSSQTSYLDYAVHSAFDYSLFDPGETVLNTHLYSKMASEEVVLNSTHAGRWRWTLGSMYRKANDEEYQFRTKYVSGLPGTRNGVESKSTTVYGELTRAFADGRFEVTGGLRYFKDDKRTWEKSRYYFINGVTDPDTGLPGLSPDSSKTYSKTTPRVVLSWHPSTQSTLYATYAEGFRSGLNQAPLVTGLQPQYQPAQPDHLKSYEIGAKGSAWDGQVNFDTAIYYLDWRNVQQQQQVTLSTTPALVIDSVFVNAKSVTGMGAEAGVSIKVIKGLTLGVTASMNGLHSTSDVLDEFGATLYAKGQRINDSPEYTASFSLDYAFPLGSSGLKGRFSASDNYIPEVIIERLGAPSTPTLSYADPVSMLRASFAVESQGRWTASLYGDNLNDARGINHELFGAFFAPLNNWSSSIRPRTIGLQVDFHY